MAACLALCAPAPASARSSPEASDFFGFDIQQLLGGHYVSSDRWHLFLQGMSNAGVRNGRSGAYWSAVEPDAPRGSVHSYRWAEFDRIVTVLARNGVRWAPVLTHSPAWAASKADDTSSPPRPEHYADFAAFAAGVAARYGIGGAFWRENPGLPQLPVTVFEIWNEQNHAHYWWPAPDPGAYVRLYNAARDAIRRYVQSPVIVGGIVWNDDANYIRGLFAAGGPGWRPDGLGSHPYSATLIGELVNVRRVSQTLQELGQASVPLYLSENGWYADPSGGPGAPRSSQGPISDRARAGLAGAFVDAVVRSDCNVRNFYLYDLVETGMRVYDSNARPDLTGQAYLDATRRYSAATEGSLNLCGDLASPTPVPAQLRLGLEVARGADGCFTANLTYRGHPIEDAFVHFLAEGGSNGGRSIATDAFGVASHCAPDATRTYTVWGEVSWNNVPQVARSDNFTCGGGGCAVVPGSGPTDPPTFGTPTVQEPSVLPAAEAPLRKAGKMGLSIRPKAVRANARTRLVFTVRRRVGRSVKPVVSATVHLAGLKLVTNKRGRVAWRYRFNRPGRFQVKATAVGLHRAMNTVRVVR
jgi:hypothetical protein